MELKRSAPLNWGLNGAEQFLLVSLLCEIQCREGRILQLVQRDLIWDRFPQPYSLTHGFEIEDFFSLKEDGKVIMYQVQKIKIRLRFSRNAASHILLDFVWVTASPVNRDREFSRADVYSSQMDGEIDNDLIWRDIMYFCLNSGIIVCLFVF